jgi:hypothetical protein
VADLSELEGMINSVLSNPDEMKKVMEMASSLMGGGAASSSPPPQEQSGSMPDLSGLVGGDTALTPEMGAAAMKLLKGFGGGNSEKHVLLNAMKPYLSEPRRTKLDKAMKLSRVLGVGLNLFGKDGGGLRSFFE